MSDRESGAAALTEARPAPRPPGAVAPRPPRAPDQRGGDLEPERTPVQIRRRTFSWLGLTGFLSTLALCTGKFFFPRTTREPKTTFTVGRPEDYAFGVDDRWQDRYRVWVCRDTEKLYVIRAICTHLGCTPNWEPAANKFKCPCHGSGFDSAGVNFEGPAPRPMDRCHVDLTADGQILVDVLRLYGEERWSEAGSHLPWTA